MTNPLAVGIILFVLGGFFMYKSFKEYHKYKLIKDIPTSKIRSLAMGLVEIFGKAKRHNPEEELLITPFSKTPCVLYSFKVEELRKGSKNSTYWSTIHSGTKQIDFDLEDETGCVRIDTARADVRLQTKKMFLQKAGLFQSFSMIARMIDGASKENPLDVSTLNLKEINTKYQSGFYRVGDKRYSEQFVADGEQLYILGTAANNATTNNKVVIKKGENESTYLISDRDESSLLKKMGWRVAGWLLGGVASFVIGLYLILIVFNL